MQPIFLILLLTAPSHFANNAYCNCNCNCNCNNSNNDSENEKENLELAKDPKNSTEFVVDEEFAAEFSEFFKKVYFRNKVNFTKAQEIYLVEAKRLGLTPLEHFKNCGKDHEVTQAYVSIKFLSFKVIEEIMISVPGRFREKDPYFDQYNTSFHKTMQTLLQCSFHESEWLLKKIRKFKDDFGSKFEGEAKKFMFGLFKNVEEFLLILCTREEHTKEQKRKAAETFGKIVTDYEVLSQQTKDSLEKVFCYRTFFAMDGLSGEDFLSELTQYKDYMIKQIY